MTGDLSTPEIQKQTEIRSSVLPCCGKVPEVTASFQYTSDEFQRD
jgi:hypothetical protein